MKKSVSVLLAMLLMICSVFAMPAYAETVLKNGIEVTLTTDKESYNSLDTIEANLTVKNTNSFAVKNVSTSITAPNGYVIDGGNASQMGTLDAGKTQNQQTSLRDADAPAPKLPRTGDDSYALIWGVMFIMTTGALCALVIKNRQAKRMIALILCVALVAPYAAGVVPAAAENNPATGMVIVSKEVLVNGEVVLLTGVVTYAEIEQANTEPAANASAFGLMINETANAVKVKAGDKLAFTGTITAAEGTTLSSVQVFVYDAKTEIPYSMGEKYYAIDGLNQAQFDLASVPEMTIGEVFGESEYALVEGGSYVIMFYAMDSEGNGFADMDIEADGNQGPMINVRVLMSPENCDHSAKEYTYVRDDSTAARVTDNEDGLTHLVEASYERYCADCGKYLMNIWGQGTNADHTIVDGMCTGCGYAPIMLMKEIPPIEFVYPGDAEDYYTYFTSDRVYIEWKDTGLSTEYVVNVKILDGEPNHNVETESGTLMSEYCDSNYTRTEMTITIPENAADKWIKINVHGKVSETEQTEAGSSLYLQVRDKDDEYGQDAPCGHENAWVSLFEKKYLVKDSREHILQITYSNNCNECDYGTEKIIFVETAEQHNFLTDGGACTACGYVQGNTCAHKYTTQTKFVSYTRQYMYDNNGNSIPSTKHTVSENVRTECSTCGVELDNERSHYDEQHEYNKKNTCVKCGYRPNNDTCRHDNTVNSTIPARYELCAEDNSMHNRIYESKTETCADCGTKIEFEYVRIQKEKHTPNKKGVCSYCGYKVDTTNCQHTEYTDYDNKKIQYTQKDATSHYYQLGYNRICDNCSKSWEVYSDLSEDMVAPHDYTNGDVCPCKYDRNTCQHTPSSVKTYNRHVFAPYDAKQHQTIAIIWDMVCSSCKKTYEMTDTVGDAENPVGLKYKHVWDEKGKCETQGCEYQCVHTFEDIMLPDGNHKAENGIWKSAGEEGHWCESIEYWEKCTNCGLEQKYTENDPYSGEKQAHMMNALIKTYYDYDENEHWKIGEKWQCTANGCGHENYVEFKNSAHEAHVDDVNGKCKVCGAQNIHYDSKFDNEWQNDNFENVSSKQEESSREDETDKIEKLINFVLNESTRSINILKSDFENWKVGKEIAGYLYDIATDTITLDFHSIIVHIQDDISKDYQNDAAKVILATMASVYSEDSITKALDGVATAFSYGAKALDYTFGKLKYLDKIPGMELEEEAKGVLSGIDKVGTGLKLASSTLSRCSELSYEKQIAVALITSNYDSTKAELEQNMRIAELNNEKELKEIYEKAISQLDDYYDAMVNNYIDNPYEVIGLDLYLDYVDAALKFADVKPSDVLKKAGGKVTTLLVAHKVTEKIMGEYLGGDQMYDSQEEILEDMIVVKALEADVRMSLERYKNNPTELRTAELLKKTITLSVYKKKMVEHYMEHDDSLWFDNTNETFERDIRILEEKRDTAYEYLSELI